MRQSITQKQSITPQAAVPAGTDGVDMKLSGSVMRVKKALVTVNVTVGTGIYEVWGRTDSRGSATWGRIARLNAGAALVVETIHEVIDNVGPYDRIALRFTGGTPTSTAVICEVLENALRGD
jgi:hypothetical protein